MIDSLRPHAPWRALFRTALASALSMAAAAPAHAGGPEQFYEPGPPAGGWSLEYNGQFGRSAGAERPHSVELFHGLTDRIALGVEVEAGSEHGTLRAEEFGASALVTLTGEEAPTEVALLLQAGVTTDGDFPRSRPG